MKAALLLVLLAIVNAVPEAQWYNQQLDHFSPDIRTWKQRYFVNETFWGGPGSPIFLYIGGEGPESGSSLTRTQMATGYAPKYKALMFALEHRFYGASQPMPDWTTESLVYLTSQQALADLATFIVDLRQQYKAESSPIIAFGGSYPGNLAAWVRMKYPSVIYASVASSAPVQAELDFFQYLDVVDKSLSFFSGPACDAQISQANQQIAQLLNTSEGTQKIETVFNVCAPFQGPDDIAQFASALMSNFMGTVQYDNEEPASPTIQTLCNMMQSNENALQAYADVSNYFLQLQGQPCLDASFSDSITFLKNTTVDNENNARQWTYQTCNEFGYYQTTDDTSINQPFGNFVSLEFNLKSCSEGFGADVFPHISYTNTYYGGNDPKDATNIFFVNGSLDPWHALSVTNTTLSGVNTILINGTAHCADMLPANENSLPSLASAQAVISDQIGVWLQASKQSNHRL